MSLFPFKATSFTNIHHMIEEFYECLESLMEKHCPKQTQHRQILPPWFSGETSHNMKLLCTARRAQCKKPNSLVLSEKGLKLDKLLLELAEEDRGNNQQKLVTTRNTTVIFKHLKSLGKTLALPKTRCPRRDSRVHSTESSATE